MPLKRQRSRSSSKASFPSKKHKLNVRPVVDNARFAHSPSIADKAETIDKEESLPYNLEHNASDHWSDEWFSAESMDGASDQSSNHESIGALEPANIEPSNSGDTHEGPSPTNDKIDVDTVDTTTKRWRKYSPSTNSTDVGTSRGTESGSHGKGDKTSLSSDELSLLRYLTRPAGHPGYAPYRCKHVCVINNFRGPIDRVIVHTICRGRHNHETTGLSRSTSSSDCEDRGVDV
ncbi:hypothetical protein EXIGLDRAFT_702739 [Exidia glandulosa HHB12029]|uniref:Uncharacterized protein n=1 Tax=Exidia glandulosa HHB12029 TaxID=1314781 RepID=A0A165CE89_EXIGL|nr:hypothetical protein EXIGLDRAFT_702739 [Exidia glandulosa HHB12029]